MSNFLTIKRSPSAPATYANFFVPLFPEATSESATRVDMEGKLGKSLIITHLYVYSVLIIAK